MVTKTHFQICNHCNRHGEWVCISLEGGWVSSSMERSWKMGSYVRSKFGVISEYGWIVVSRPSHCTNWNELTYVPWTIVHWYGLSFTHTLVGRGLDNIVRYPPFKSHSPYPPFNFRFPYPMFDFRFPYPLLKSRFPYPLFKSRFNST